MAESAPTRWRATVPLQEDACEFKEGLLVSKTGTQVLDLVACTGGKAQASGWGRKVWIGWTMLAGGQPGAAPGCLVPSERADGQQMCSLGRGPREGNPVCPAEFPFKARAAHGR